MGVWCDTDLYAPLSGAVLVRTDQHSTGNWESRGKVGHKLLPIYKYVGKTPPLNLCKHTESEIKSGIKININPISRVSRYSSSTVCSTPTFEQPCGVWHTANR